MSDLHKTTITLLLALVALAGTGVAQTVVPVAINGDAGNRVDLLVLGDGYTASEMPKFASDVEGVVAGLFAQDPFHEYQKYFNVRRLEMASAESGVSHPERGITRNTAFGAYYNCANIQRLVCVDVNKVLTAVAAVALDERDIILLLVNDTEYGGSGGQITVASLSSASLEITLHETGHSFGGLADEYGGPPPPPCQDTFEPVEPNATRETARDNIKWRLWIDDSTPVPTLTAGDGVPGLYAGARYCDSTLYRPTLNSKMRALGQPFWQISTEQLVKRIYGLVDPVDARVPSTDVFVEPGVAQDFSVATPAPSSHNFEITWFLDDVLQPDQSPQPQSQFTLPAGALTPGLHTLKAVVVDPTSLVRIDPDHLLVGSATWTVAPATDTPYVPELTWPAPAPIIYGTPLGSTQLNATALFSGTFTYTPAAGTILPAGLHLLSVVFTPQDTIHVATASKTVPLTVQDFSLPSSLPPMTVLAGQRVSTTFAITSVNGFAGPVEVTCSFPANMSEASCLATGAIVPAGASADGTLIVATTGPHRVASAWAAQRLTASATFSVLAGFLFLGALKPCRRGHRLRHHGISSLLLILLLTTLSCGTSKPGTTDPGTPPGTYTVSIIARGGPAAHSLNVSVTVQ